MLTKILLVRTTLLLLLGLALSAPGAYAQGHEGGHDSGRGGGNHGPRTGGHGSRHYYHNGNWNRNGWYGWGVPGPVYADGVLVASLPPGYSTVMVGGNSYFYGNDMYFRQMPAGGYAVVTLPVAN